MQKFLALVLGALILTAVPAAAQKTCSPLTTIVQAIDKSMPIKGMVKLDDEQTKRVVAWYNAQEPVSNDTYTLAVVTLHDGNQMGLLLGNGEEICFASLVPPELMKSFVNAITGGQGV